jgi:hypothetical protein
VIIVKAERFFWLWWFILQFYYKIAHAKGLQNNKLVAHAWIFIRNSTGWYRVCNAETVMHTLQISIRNDVLP